MFADHPWISIDNPWTSLQSSQIFLNHTWISVDNLWISMDLFFCGFGEGCRFLQNPSAHHMTNVMSLIKKSVSSKCNPTELDHGVAIVGFGSTPMPYWIIRNSWGASWGEKGYLRIARGKGTCGLNTMVTTATKVTMPSSEIVV